MMAGWVAIYETYRSMVARRQAHQESFLQSARALFSRNPRRYGGYLIHVGITIIGLGVIGSTMFKIETQRTLAVGESLDIGGYTLRYDQLRSGQIADDGRTMDIADITILRGGQELTKLRPRRDFFTGAQGMDTMTIAGAYSTLEATFTYCSSVGNPLDKTQPPSRYTLTRSLT